MWRRHRNSRRARRADVLRVKAAVKRQPHWGRRVVVALLVAVGATLAMHTALRSWTSVRDDLLLSNRFFSLQTIEVNTNLIWLTPQQILAWANVRVGDNLLALDLDRIKRDLELVPQVEEAAVERVLPHVLSICVRERQPLAQVRGVYADHGRLLPTVFFLDAHARVMPPLVAGRPDLQAAYASLPVISGLDNRSLRVGRDLPSPGVRVALNLVQVFPHSPMAGQVGLSSLDVAEPDIVQVTTDRGAEIRLPLAQLDWQLQRWRLVHDAVARLGHTLRWLDLSMTNNCPVLWETGEPEPPAPPPRPVETTFNGGRHV